MIVLFRYDIIVLDIYLIWVYVICIIDFIKVYEVIGVDWNLLEFRVWF